MNDENATPPLATCERCGAPIRAPAAREDPVEARTAATPVAPAGGAAPATYCAWCGAEYPLPDAALEH